MISCECYKCTIVERGNCECSGCKNPLDFLPEELENIILDYKDQIENNNEELKKYFIDFIRANEPLQELLTFSKDNDLTVEKFKNEVILQGPIVLNDPEEERPFIFLSQKEITGKDFALALRQRYKYRKYHYYRDNCETIIENGIQYKVIEVSFSSMKSLLLQFARALSFQ